MENELVKGGQGRHGDSLVRDAFVVLFSVILGAAIVAGGATLHYYVQKTPTITVTNIPPTPPSVKIAAKITSPKVEVKAQLISPERIVERVKVSPVTVQIPKLDVPNVIVNLQCESVRKKKVDRYGELLPNLDLKGEK